MAESLEKMMHALRLGGLAHRWQEVEYRDREQYLGDLLALELSIREVNRINRLLKTAGFRTQKTLEDFEWTPAMQMPSGIDR